MRKPRILGTPARTSAQIPKCKQCIEADLKVRSKMVDALDPTRHVVSFMGDWACLVHYRIQNPKHAEKAAMQPNPGVPLQELFPNRAYRRRADRHSKASRVVAPTA